MSPLSDVRLEQMVCVALPDDIGDITADAIVPETRHGRRMPAPATPHTAAQKLLFRPALFDESRRAGRIIAAAIVPERPHRRRMLAPVTPHPAARRHAS